VNICEQHLLLNKENKMASRKKIRAKICSLFQVAILALSMPVSMTMAADKIVVIPLVSLKSVGDAKPTDVLVGKTFSSDDGLELTGTRPTAAVPATGRTACYDENGSSRSCTGTGEDGEYQRGVLTLPRFTDNQDSTVTDNLTNLMWLQDANCIVSQYHAFAADGKVSWQQALDFVAGMNDDTYARCNAGHNDWRLPNVKELYSLVDLSNAIPPLPTNHLFSHVETSLYWTSSTSAFCQDGIDANACAWVVSFNCGRVWRPAKTKLYCVWPVRGGM
jgi:hypothetical protein